MTSLTLIVVTFMAQAAYSFNCSIPPIYVDIHNRAVHGSNLFQYGAFIGLGNPAQNFSLWPSFTHNETSFAATDFCTASSPPDCANTTHGTFASDISKTWQPLPQYQPFDSDDDNTTSISVEYGEDTMYLYTHYFETNPATSTNCSAFPFSLLSNSTSSDTSFFGPEGVLGLGSSSVNLEQLYANKVITSRSVGLYLGTGYDRAGGMANGSMTYGGYDAGRFTDPVHSYALSPSVFAEQSPLMVHVSQISLDTPGEGGGSTRLVNDAGFDARISTSQYPLTLPRSVTSAFANALSATAANDSTNSLKLPRSFAGNLTITLSDGFRISFPPEWVSNISNLTPISASPLSSTPDPSESFTLGAAFLEQIYLTVSYDSHPPTFYLAPAIPLNAIGVMPVTLCPSSAPTPYHPPVLTPFVKGGLIGAIIGGVIGGSAITLLTWMLVRSFLQRRQRKQVRFAVGKVVEIEEGEEMEHVVSAGAGRGQSFAFKPPMTPGQPVTPGQAPRMAFPGRQQSVPSQSSSGNFKGPTDRGITVVTTFDPPPRGPVGGQMKQKGGRWR